ncbi:MAG: non-heme iron oxygenase ferredoxin subunit [Candidatus Verstraetearchaeota archaeon]|nr:non-heme iron oxygenase ferredoxin subunit [Candidatus Verstraetearchaeota archaeon]
MVFYKVVAVSELPPNSMRAFTVQGKEILVANLGGKFFSIDNRCSHRKGDLSKGKLEGEVVICPLHGSKFELASGKAISGPKIGPVRGKTPDLKSYPVKVEGESVMVDLPA